jgi:hypothetical protein
MTAKPVVELRLRSMEYPVSPELVSVQVRLIWLVETAVAVTEPGADSVAADAWDASIIKNNAIQALPTQTE